MKFSLHVCRFTKDVTVKAYIINGVTMAKSTAVKTPKRKPHAKAALRMRMDIVVSKEVVLSA